MDLMQKILLAMGSFYILLGGSIAAVFFMIDGFGIGVLIPSVFLIIGIIMDFFVIRAIIKKSMIKRKGKKYSSKIYSYAENTSFTVNGQYTMNVKVHYFDTNGIEREAIIPTCFEKGSDMYPIGMTIDIYEYNGKFDYNPKSVRDQILPREDELMDNRPIDPELQRFIAFTCPNCGSSFQALRGYANNCPYCGSAHNN